MGTRSTIQVNDLETETTVIFYKHWDGYPSDNLDMFKESFKSAKNVNGFLESCAKYYKRNLNEMIEFCGPLDLKAVENESYMQHGDLEFHYQVDFKNKNINVFGGGYGTEKELINRGLFNPLKEVERYKEDYQEELKRNILDILTELATLNISVNKK